MDSQNPQHMENAAPAAMTTNAKVAPKAAMKSSSSKEPVQQTTPGPKHAAAPQLPVIQ